MEESEVKDEVDDFEDNKQPKEEEKKFEYEECKRCSLTFPHELLLCKEDIKRQI